MMRPEEFDLFPAQRYTDSAKQVLRQTMLNHEVVFRNQVHELHRLYRVQESIMQRNGWEQSDYVLWKAKLQSSLHPFSNPIRCESLAEQPRFSLTSKLGATPFVHQKLLKDNQCSRALDLQLSADKFIDLTEDDLPGKEKLKLSLTLGGGNRRIARRRPCLNMNTHYCSQNVIDLEDSVESTSDGNTKCHTLSEGKHELQGDTFNPIIPMTVRTGVCQEIAESSSFQEYSECCQEQVSSNEGIEKSQKDAPSDNGSKKRHFSSYQGGLLDLNKDLQEDSSNCSEDDMMAYPSKSSFEGDCDGLPVHVQDRICPTRKNEFSSETSGMPKQDNPVNHALLDLNEAIMVEDSLTCDSNECVITESKKILTRTESIHSPPESISRDLGCCSGDDKNVCIEVKSKTSCNTSSEKSVVENPILSCTDQSQNTFQDGNCKSPASCKSCCISDNDSSNAQKLNFGVTSSVLNKEQLDSQVSGILSVEEQRISNSSDPKTDNCNMEEDLCKTDVLMEEAAELLVRMHSACRQDSNEEVGSDETKLKPLRSSDSYELIAINLTESSNVDDDSVSSKRFDIAEMEAKEFGLKLRRGRRMKDFQKEILPSLKSLSRQEILEDIHLMEGVLKSREYRKMRGKMSAGQGNTWSAPVRSRRSRPGRRNFS